MALETPVLIVGAGPSGLAAACELAHQGVACLVAEPRTSVSVGRPRAKTTSIRTMELFRRWGIATAIREAAPLNPNWSDRVVFADALTGHAITEFTDCFGLCSTAASPEVGQQIPQPLVEEVLRAHLATNPLVDFLWGARLIDLDTSQSDRVTARLDDGQRSITVQADYVLGCDGPSSPTRQSTGIELRGESDPRPNFNAVFHAPQLRTDLGDAVQYWIVNERTSGLIGRLDLDGTWWAIMPGVDAEQGRAHVSRLLENLVGGPFPHHVLSTDSWNARMTVADSYRKDRVFLVGEAAHQNPPFGGHGYNTCIGDAVNLSWKLAGVLAGWADPGLLNTYEQERKPIAQITIAAARQNMGGLPGDFARQAAQGTNRVTLAEHIQRSKFSEFHSAGLVLGYTYGQPSPDTTVHQANQKSAVPTDLDHYTPNTEVGSRLPHCLDDQQRPLFDALGRGFTLLGPEPHSPAAIATRNQAHTFNLPLDIVERPTTLPAPYDWLLIRPDQHIAWHGNHIDQTAIITAMWPTATYQEIHAGVRSRDPADMNSPMLQRRTGATQNAAHTDMSNHTRSGIHE
ncbi:FAD-dependent monooxygenase [Mycolicibacterium stellerae]|uniref:FAD-dependent monooxygenase n=1 Tax=Mycolicibacterium stellerae TaxID=2358193 RepID=UPI000F0AFDD4|nr:FAD-dependent monooxygenase [Mycolicibacterium stellerae]